MDQFQKSPDHIVKVCREKTQRGLLMSYSVQGHLGVLILAAAALVCNVQFSRCFFVVVLHHFAEFDTMYRIFLSIRQIAADFRHSSAESSADFQRSQLSSFENVGF